MNTDKIKNHVTTFRASIAKDFAEFRVSPPGEKLKTFLFTGVCLLIGLIAIYLVLMFAATVPSGDPNWKYSTGSLLFVLFLSILTSPDYKHNRD